MDFKNSVLPIVLESSKLNMYIYFCLAIRIFNSSKFLLGEIPEFNILFSVTEVLVNLCLPCYYVFLKYPIKTYSSGNQLPVLLLWFQAA